MTTGLHLPAASELQCGEPELYAYFGGLCLSFTNICFIRKVPANDGGRICLNFKTVLEDELPKFYDVFVNGIKFAEKGLIRSLHLDLEINHVRAKNSRGVDLNFILVLSYIRISNFATKHILHMFSLNILQFYSQLIDPLPGLLNFVLGSIQKLNNFLFRLLEL